MNTEIVKFEAFAAALAPLQTNATMNAGDIRALLRDAESTGRNLYAARLTGDEWARICAVRTFRGVIKAKTMRGWCRVKPDTVFDVR